MPQIFNVNAGSKILHTWSAEIDNIAEFEIVVNEPARSFTVSPLGDNPTTSPRTATITVTATIDSGTTRAEHEIKGTYTVTQEAGKPLSPDTPLPTIPMGDPDSKGNILIFHGEGDNAALGLGTWSNNDTDSATPGKITAANYLTTIAYFKWGGVIGFNNADGYTTFNSTVGNEPTNAVMFNPSNVLINAYTDIPSYKTIPATGTVADAAYTSGANVLLGKGDPCRLVGLTVAQIKAAATDPSQWNAMMDASDWRMPIDAENLTFSGNHPIGDGSWYNISSVTSGGSWTQAAPGVAICVQSGNAVLPATGLRSPDLGESKSRGEQGGYWCSTPLENTGTAVIFNSSKFWRINLPNQSCGYALRCVPQD